MKNSSHPTLTFMGIASLVLLTACGTDSKSTGRSDADDRLTNTEGSLLSGMPRLTNVQDTQRPANIRVREGLFLGSEGFRGGRGEPLPARFETPDGISLNIGGAEGIEAFATIVEQTTGIRVDYSDLASFKVQDTPGAGTSSSAGEASGMADSTGSTPAVPENSGPAAAAGGSSANVLAIPLQISYSGKLSGLLDQVSGMLGADWVYEGGRIKFQGPQTVTYTLWALPTTTSNQSGVGNGAEGAFGGSSPAVTTSTYEVDYWSTFETGLQAIVPSGDAAFAVNRGAGTIVVTGREATHRRVQAFIEGENQRLSRQVAVKIDVVAFTRTRSDAKSSNLKLALDAAAQDLKLSVLTPTNPIENSIGLGAEVISGDATGSVGFLNALAKQGRVSILNSVTVTASNNTPTPMSITSDKAYLAGVTTTQTDEGEETSLESGLISTGINAVVTPRILSSGDMILQYTMNLSELKNIENFSTGDGASQIQLPEVTSRNFMQTVNISSGSSLVIAAFNQETARNESNGPFNPAFWGLGGKASYSVEDTRVMVIMTPVVLENQNLPRQRR